MSMLPLVPDLSQRVLVSECFLSIQGEGKLVGTPSYFIRLSGCNLRCTWCDTPYASWNPEGSKQSLEELVRAAATSQATHVVLTGGEPMIFDAVEPLARALRVLGMHITIETAGTVFRPATVLACDLMSLSPKLANSTPSATDPRDPTGSWAARHEARRINIPILQQLLDAHRVHQLKFVVSADADIAEIHSLLAQLKNWSPQDVLLMPEGVTLPSPATKAWLIDICLKNNFRYCPRLHIELFGNIRGT